MKSKVYLLAVIFFVAASANAAQLYRWVDAKGNVEWRDTPPPTTAGAKKVEQRKIGDNVIPTGETSFAMQLATKNHPVTFWASSDCGKVCDPARAHLNRRGTPYTEKSPGSDIEAFKKLSGGLEVPYLQVGAISLKGYLESEYDNTLDAAGYPRTVVALKPKPAAPAPKPTADGAKPAAVAAPAPAATSADNAKK